VTALLEPLFQTPGMSADGDTIAILKTVYSSSIK